MDTNSKLTDSEPVVGQSESLEKASPEVTGEEPKKFNGAERRLFDRIQYQNRLPTISIGEDRFSVRDLSVISLRFANTYMVDVPASAFRATVHLLCGEDVPVTGIVYRKLKHDMVMMMKQGIPVDLIRKERKYVQKLAERERSR